VEWNGRLSLHRVDDWFAALAVRLTLKREQPAVVAGCVVTPCRDPSSLLSPHGQSTKLYTMRVLRKTKPVDTVKARSLAEVGKPNLCRMCNHH